MTLAMNTSTQRTVMTDQRSKCPTHQEQELRVEYTAGKTGFCPKCCRNYSLCTATYHMDDCQKLVGHGDAHQTKQGILF